MLLFDYKDAPNPKVVRMFALEKGIDLPRRPVDILDGENRRAPYNIEINRTGRVPALQLETGAVLFEVLPICEYLEERFPDPPLIGATLEERAETRAWTRWIDLNYVERMSEACAVVEGPIRDHYAKNVYKTMLPASVGLTMVQIAHEKLAWFNGEMGDRRFVCGGQISLADIHLYAFLEFFTGIGLSHPAELEWINGFIDLMRSRPSAAA